MKKFLRACVMVSVIASLLVGVVVPPQSGQAASPPPWKSGVSVNYAWEAETWAAQRGRPVNVVNVFTDLKTKSWDVIVDPVYVWDHLKGFKGQVVVSQPLWPIAFTDRKPTEHLRYCAQGNYTAQWKKFGTSMVKAGRSDAIVRLAWEANGTWFDWQASDTGLWKQCFQNTVRAIRSTNRAAKIEWSINAHYSHLPLNTHNAYDLYPGDGFVDIVGMSAYDHYPPSRDQTAWDQQFRGQGGLLDLIVFAHSHDKKFAVGEWGVSSKVGAGGMDNPFYVQKMHDVFSFFRNDLAYEAYHNEAVKGKVMSALFIPDANTQSSAKYRQLWSNAR